MHTVYRDRNGREYICDNGRRVYIDSQQTFDQGQQHGTGYRGLEGQEYQHDQGSLTPTPAIPADPNAEAGAAAQATASTTTGRPARRRRPTRRPLRRRMRRSKAAPARRGSSPPRRRATSTRPTRPAASSSQATRLDNAVRNEGLGGSPRSQSEANLFYAPVTYACDIVVRHT